MVLTSAPSITDRAGTPRSAVVDFPLGHTSGPPDDPATQRALLVGALEAAAAMTAPGDVTHLPWRWADESWKADPLSWSRRQQDEGRAGHSDGDTRVPRSEAPVYQSDDDRAAAEAVSWEDQCQVCLGLPER